MTQSLSIPMAWCIELDTIVSPQDILKYRKENPDETLTFICPECQLPLTFHPKISGIAARGYFIRRTGQYHHHCSAKIRRENQIPQNVILFQDFEDAFEGAENALKDLKTFLDHCREVCERLKEIAPQNTDHPHRIFLELLEKALDNLPSPCTTVEPELSEIATAYISLRHEMTGY